MDEDHKLAMALVKGIARADKEAIAECFTPGARFRALIPPGPVERHGAAEASETIASWFVDADPLTIVSQSVDHLSDRLHVSYRLKGTELGKGFVVQQQVYAEVVDGRLNDVTLLCSGFRPSTP